MTKRKAIEMALSRWVKVRKEEGFTAVDVEDVIVGAAVEQAYDAGCIAGLREAARLVSMALRNARKIENLCFLSMARIADAIHIVLTDTANQLAKKARAKKGAPSKS